MYRRETTSGEHRCSTTRLSSVRKQLSRVCESLTGLLTKQLAFGGPVFKWTIEIPMEFQSLSGAGGMQKDELLIEEHDYCFAVTYTREDLSSVLSKRQRTCRLKRCA
jgi:hypothetical protein